MSPDGRTLYVSRGHRGDVAAFSIKSGRLLWKVPIPGLRADHMTISDDGSRLYVSALTEDEVEVIDTERRAIVATFPSGQWPHDNHVSPDGARLYNGSIGNIVAPEESARRPPRRVAVPAHRRRLDDTRAGPLVRLRARRPPVRVTHDERTMYAQLSEFHGVVKFDLDEGRIVRRRSCRSTKGSPKTTTTSRRPPRPRDDPR